MQERIRRICEARGHATRSVSSLRDLPHGSEPVIVIDAAALIALATHGELDDLLGRRFVFVVGENIDRAGSTFVGWQKAAELRDMTLKPGGRLREVIQRAWRITWQSDRVRDAERQIRSEAGLFFPIDGYEPSVLVPAIAPPDRDIDLLFYGSMSFPRRANFARRMFETPLLTDRRIVVASNVFDLDDLLSRAKIVLHVNAVDDCEHVPYAKIVKPLANHRPTFVETTPELERSDLRRFIATFAVDDDGLFSVLRETLDNFPARQADLDALDPRDWLERNYDFERNVVELLSL